MTGRTQIRSTSNSMVIRPKWLSPATPILGILAIGLVAGVLGGVSLPLIAGDREALIALTLIGMAMCGSGPLGQIAGRGAWLSWAGIAGSGLGILALGVVAATLFGFQVPLVADERGAFVALTAIGIVKLGLGLVYRLAH